MKGLNALLGIVSTPGSAPVITGARLRKGSTNSAKGAHRFVADNLVTAKAAGATGMLVVRADSAFYQADVIAAVLRHQSFFSITARHNPPVRKAIDSISDDAWTPIKYTNAVFDEDQQRWISDAQVAEIDFTAFTSKSKTRQVTARLIVRRVPDVNPANQSPLFTVYRYHAVFTNSPLPMLAAESAHRGHAIVEQIIADLKNGPLAHLPSGHFWANSAWLVCAAMAFNLTRAAGALASTFHARAKTGTIRDQLINVPARLAKSARRLVLHLPSGWPWETPWTQLATGARHGPPVPARPPRPPRPTRTDRNTTWRPPGQPGRTSTPSADQHRPARLKPSPDHPTVDPGLGPDPPSCCR